MDHVFSRSQLYDLVWAEPMSILAKRYGVSDVGLAKACRRSDIPVPERGYWAKLKHGKAVKRPRLPTRADLPDRVTIAPPRPKPEPSPAAKTLLEIEPPKIEVPVEGGRLHWLVREWDEKAKQRRRELKALDTAWFRSPPPKPPTEVDLRIRRLYSALLRALEKAAFKVGDGDRGGVAASKDGETIEFHIYQRQTKGRRPLTAEEKQDPWNKGKTDQYELRDTGDLVLKVRTYSRGGAMAEDYRDQKAPLEEQLGQIVVAFDAGIAELKAWHRRLALEAEQGRQAEIARAHRARYREQEEAARERLLKTATRRQEAERVRALIVAAEGSDQANREDFAAWKTWALAEADRLDPLVNGLELKLLAPFEEWLRG